MHKKKRNFNKYYLELIRIKVKRILPIKKRKKSRRKLKLLDKTEYLVFTKSAISVQNMCSNICSMFNVQGVS